MTLTLDIWPYPSINPHSQGNPRRKWAAIASAQHSARHGEKARRSTVNDSFLRAWGSRPSPARIRITVSAICLQKHRQYQLCNTVIDFIVLPGNLIQCNKTGFNVKHLTEAIHHMLSRQRGNSIWFFKYPIHQHDKNHITKIINIYVPFENSWDIKKIKSCSIDINLAVINMLNDVFIYYIPNTGKSTFSEDQHTFQSDQKKKKIVS